MFADAGPVQAAPCVPCPAGSVAPDTASMECSTCGPGYYGNEDGRYRALFCHGLVVVAAFGSTRSVIRQRPPCDTVLVDSCAGLGRRPASAAKMVPSEAPPPSSTVTHESGACVFAVLCILGLGPPGAQQSARSSHPLHPCSKSTRQSQLSHAVLPCVHVLSCSLWS